MISCEVDQKPDTTPGDENPAPQPEDPHNAIPQEYRLSGWDGVDFGAYQSEMETANNGVSVAYTRLNLTEELKLASEKRVLAQSVESLFSAAALPDLFELIGEPTSIQAYYYTEIDEVLLYVIFGNIALICIDAQDDLKVDEILLAEVLSNIIVDDYLYIGQESTDILAHYSDFTSQQVTEMNQYDTPNVYFYGFGDGDHGFLNYQDKGITCRFYQNRVSFLFITPPVDGGTYPVLSHYEPADYSLPDWTGFDENLYDRTVTPPESGDTDYRISYELKAADPSDLSKARAMIDAGAEALFNYPDIDSLFRDFGLPDQISVIVEDQRGSFLNFWYSGLHLFFGWRSQHSHIDEIRYSGDTLPISVNGSLTIGSSIDDVKSLYSNIRDAQPEEYIDGNQDWEKNGVYFSGLHGGDFGYLNLSDEGIRIFFAHDLINAIYLPFPEGQNPAAGTIEWVE